MPPRVACAVSLIVFAGVIVGFGCGTRRAVAPGTLPAANEPDLATARKGFATKEEFRGRADR